MLVGARRQCVSTKILATGLFLFVFLYGFDAQAQTPPNENALGALERSIQEIEIQISVLQARLTEARNALQRAKEEPAASTPQEQNVPLLTRTLAIGSRGDDVKELQKFLSQFPDIYPDKLVTGFYGIKTAAAIRKFQEQQGIEIVGNLGLKTLARINELLTSGAGKSGVAPPGLTTAPGIQKQLAATTTITVATSTCATNYSLCYAKSECEAAKFFWYTVSCHKNPPPTYSCAESYSYCINSNECSKNGWYWCRNSCYPTLEGCQGQIYVAPATPAVPAIPAQPITQTGTTTVPTVLATTTSSTATTTVVASTSVTSATTTTTTTGVIPSSPLPLTVTITSITPYSPLAPNNYLISSIHLQWNTTASNLNFKKTWRKFGDGDWMLVGIGQPNSVYDLNIGAGTYSYKVNACASGSHIAPYDCGPDSNIVTTTLAMGGGGSDTTPPGAPTGLRVWPDPYNRNFFSWTAPTDNVGVVGYNIYRNGTYLKSTCCTPSEDGFLFSDLTPFNYTVAAYDAAGNISPKSSPVSATTQNAPATIPVSPSNLIYSRSSDNATVTLSWADSSANETRFEILKRINGSFAPIGQVAANVTSFSETPPAGTYDYTVRACNDVGCSNSPSPINVVVGASTGDTTAPSIPTGVRLSSPLPGYSSVNLYWNASTDNVSVAGYKVYQNGVFIVDTGGAANNTEVGNLSNGYSYTVAAYDGAGNISAQSSSVSVSPTATTTSFKARRENLAAISEVVGSLNAALDALIQLLKRF